MPRSGSVTGLTLDDVKSLIIESEERIITKLQSVVSSNAGIEKRFDAIQAEQVRVGLEVKEIKQVIVKQQLQVEHLEAERRKRNLIFANVPEDDVNVDNITLQTDEQKVSHLCGRITDDFNNGDILSCSRIGTRKAGQKRLLLVKFNDMDVRRKILTSQRALRDDESFSLRFGRVYVNKDASTLVRKEEKRLRDVMKELKASSGPARKIYIKAGKLYCDSELIDEINIGNQLF